MQRSEYQEHVRETVLHLICDDQLEVIYDTLFTFSIQTTLFLIYNSAVAKKQVMSISLFFWRNSNKI